MMINKGNYLAAADHELECDILQVGRVTLGVLMLDWMDTVNVLIFSSHIQETSACLSPCQGRSLA